MPRYREEDHPKIEEMRAETDTDEARADADGVPETLNDEEILDRLSGATNKFLTEETTLLDVDANERSITHHLAIRVKEAFPNWDVDCEYNRIDDKKKRLPEPRPTSSDDTRAITIYPDIVVHRRRTNFNCAVIEVKKVGNNSNVELDLYKLRGLTDMGDYRYRVGLHLTINCKDAKIASVEVYKLGATHDKLTDYATGRFVR